jgi:citrate lyase subunit beta/citryl-CoA lyase
MTNDTGSQAEPLRRSAHFVPGANERMFAKALDTAADTLILDLEDAVTPARKDSARQAVAEWLKNAEFGGKERTVRMNPLDSPWGLADLATTMVCPPDAYVVPKVSTLAELMAIDAQLTALERQHGHDPGQVGLILVATETPLAVLNLRTFTDCDRVRALSWGAEDLSAALGAPRNRRPDGTYLDTYRHCRVQTLLAAAAGGAQAVDTVFVDIRDRGGLAAECEEAAWMGYTGKITIHPDQIDIVNAAFTPAAEVVAEARELLALFEQEQAAGRMAFSFKGQMVDVPHLERARRIVERAARINA